MSQPSFDPCKQWLGIDAVDLGDPRRVLGLGPLDRDPQAIIRAATIKLSLLQSVSPGAFAMAHAALLRRVAEARDALLAEAAASAPPRLSMPPPPPAVAGAIPATPPRPAVPLPPPVPRPPAVPGGAPPHDAEPDPLVAFTPRRVPTYKRKSSSGPLLLAVAALSAVAGVMAYRIMQPQLLAKTDREIAVRPSGTAAPADTASTRQKKRGSNSRTDEASATTEKDAASTSPPPDEQERLHAMRRERLRKDSDGEQRTDADDTSEPENEPDNQPQPQTEPEPEPAPEETPPDPAVDTLVREAFKAIQKQEFDGARIALGAARKAASTAAMKDRITSFEELSDCAEKFFEYREQALAAVRSGIEYDIPTKQGSRKIAIVEINDDELVFREAGKRDRWSRDKIPAAVLTHIVREWFDARPENQLFLGAYFATKPEPDLPAAREEWAAAQAGGADAAGLLQLLDDPVLTAAAE